MKTRRTKEEVGRQHQGMDRPGVRQVPEGSGEQGKMEKSGCKIICGAPTTLAVKGLLMMMMSVFRIGCRCHLAGPLCFMEHDAKEDGEQCWGQDAPWLDTIGDGEAA